MGVFGYIKALLVEGGRVTPMSLLRFTLRLYSLLSFTVVLTFKFNWPWYSMGMCNGVKQGVVSRGV